MGLRQQADLDNAAIVEDAVGGFGWPVTVTDPNDVTAELIGLTTDIGYVIDPQTGQAVIDQKASVALRIASLTAAGMGMPRNVGDRASKPWRISFADINGTVFTFSVLDAMPDRAIGLVVCLLQQYQP